MNEKLETVVDGNANRTIENVSTWVEVRWAGECAYYPVRFEEKTSLPRVPGARRATEGELLEYFLLGREPWTVNSGDSPSAPADIGGPEGPVDTRYILSYFIRKCVEALPGLEAEILRAVHSMPALRATCLARPVRPSWLGERRKVLEMDLLPGSRRRLLLVSAFSSLRLLLRYAGARIKPRSKQLL